MRTYSLKKKNRKFFWRNNVIIVLIICDVAVQMQWFEAFLEPPFIPPLLVAEPPQSTSRALYSVQLTTWSSSAKVDIFNKIFL